MGIPTTNGSKRKKLTRYFAERGSDGGRAIARGRPESGRRTNMVCQVHGKAPWGLDTTGARGEHYEVTLSPSRRRGRETRG